MKIEKYGLKVETGEAIDKQLKYLGDKFSRLRQKIVFSDAETSGKKPAGFFMKLIAIATLAIIFGKAIEVLWPNFHDYDYVGFFSGWGLIVIFPLLFWSSLFHVGAGINNQLAAIAPKELNHKALFTRFFAGVGDDILSRALLVPVAMFCLYLADDWVLDACWTAVIGGMIALMLLPIALPKIVRALRKKDPQIILRSPTAKWCLVGALGVAAFVFMSDEVPQFFDRLVVPVANVIANIATFGLTSDVLLDVDSEHTLHGMLLAGLAATDTAKYKKGGWRIANWVLMNVVMIAITFGFGLFVTLIVRGLYEVWCDILLYILRKINTPPALPSS